MTVIETELAVDNSPSSSPLQSASKWLMVVSVLIVAAVALAFLLLALPANDDYLRATQPREMGWWNYVFKFMYNHWQGRWAACGLESAILPLGDMTRIYPAMIGSIALVNLIGLYVICRYFTRSASAWFSAACTVGLAAVLWAEMPSVAQGIYWFTGTVENAMVLSFVGMLLVGLISLRSSIPWMIVAALAAIFTCGLHEAYGAMLCLALAAGTLAAYWMKSENRSVWLVALIAAVIGLGIVVGAPGNRIRMQTDGKQHGRQFVYDLKVALAQFWQWSREWLFDPKLIAASLWIAFSPRLEASRPVWTNSRRVPWRLLLPVVWLGLLAIGFFAPSWAFGAAMPPRTLSANFIVFAVGWMIIVFVWTRRLDLRDTAPAGPFILRSGSSSAVAKLVLAFALVLTGNSTRGLHDLITRTVFRWRSSVEHRYALLRASGPSDRVIPRITPTSGLLFTSEIWPDPNDPHNSSMAAFFHLKKVSVPVDVISDTSDTPKINPDPAPPTPGENGS